VQPGQQMQMQPGQQMQMQPGQQMQMQPGQQMQMQPGQQMQMQPGQQMMMAECSNYPPIVQVVPPEIVAFNQELCTATALTSDGKDLTLSASRY